MKNISLFFWSILCYLSLCVFYLMYKNWIVFVDITKSGSQTIKHEIIGCPLNSNIILYETAVGPIRATALAFAWRVWVEPCVVLSGLSGTQIRTIILPIYKYRNLRRNEPAWWHVVGWQYLFIPSFTSRTHKIWYSHIFKTILISTFRSYSVKNLKLILIFYKICYTNKNEVLISVVKPKRCTNVSNLFYFGLTLYMFRTVVPSIIRSSRLYIHLQAYAKQILLSAC